MMSWPMVKTKASHRPGAARKHVRYRNTYPRPPCQCRLAYFDHAAVRTFVLVRMGLASLMVAGASWRVPCWPGFLTG